MEEESLLGKPGGLSYFKGRFVNKQESPAANWDFLIIRKFGYMIRFIDI
jgi:hypothetical protein